MARGLPTSMYPMSETHHTFIKLSLSRISECKGYDSQLDGKWILNFPRCNMDSKWQEAVALYRARKLTGVVSIHCSTAAAKKIRWLPEPSKPSMGVILFVCGPYDDSESVIRYGNNIVEKMNYTDVFQYVVYKIYQQPQGNADFESTNKYYYKIPLDKSLYIKL